MYYTLDENKKPVRCTLEEYADWTKSKGNEIEKAQELHRVAETTIVDYWVSTVFLAIDHSFRGDTDHTPILFETMIFNQKTDSALDYQQRYATWKEALEGHKEAVEFVIQMLVRKER